MVVARPGLLRRPGRVRVCQGSHPWCRGRTTDQWRCKHSAVTTVLRDRAEHTVHGNVIGPPNEGRRERWEVSDAFAVRSHRLGAICIDVGQRLAVVLEGCG